MKILLSITLFFLLGCFSCKKQSSEEHSKPNIIVIIADDAGWSDFSFHNSKIKTPNIDALTEKGLQLNRFYVNPTCSPSRASFFTGRPASRMGIVAPISGKSKLSLPDSVTTLPQLLKKKGYKTALFGKWHLGLNPENGPKKYGFDYSYGFLHGQIDQYTHKYKNGDQSWHRNGNFIEEKGHTTDLITNETIKWLDSIEDTSKNFFVQIAYSAPHFPLQEEEHWKAPYKDVFKNQSRVDYAASMAHMDDAIGKIFTHLKEKQLDENTIILFFSDNGAMENWYPKEQYNGKFDDHPELGKNLPLRDWKTSNYEGAIRTPAIVYWKDHTSNGINNEYISVIDMMPTLAKFIGAESIPNTVEGIDVSNAILNNQTLIDREIYVRGHRQESIIVKPWKLIRTRSLDGPIKHELYNLDTDPFEKNNVLEQHPDIFAELEPKLIHQFNKDSKTVNLGLPQ
ncbi:sulfatase-like hydrolase/transferase [Galbibacter sp. EGI 63066]|uniref:sulfatase-like hydrolase/transferase n=1 Tax=Galbibacter sp. EGI 63066 TaxID=2993559 RepID=UPI002249280A|nr:sulfatase-like hydrolase/transferase [Galbibacter sp. EGI 63066]MCX2680300.1 sulfatase-like hydrolase/transferase [Galbibacter sp. EGI 63066]